MTTPPPAPLEDAVPLFGARSTPLAHRSFRIAVYRARRPNDPPVEETFSTWEEPDTGSVMTMLGAATEGEQQAAVFRILMGTLRDDDGVSVEYVQPLEPMTVEEFDEWRETGSGVDVTRYAREDVPDEATDPDEPLIAYAPGEGDGERLAWWLGPEGPTTNVDDLVVPDEEGSSVRRFAYLMDDRARRVDWSALLQLAEWMVKRLAGRPTKRPQPSRHGPPSTGRGASAGVPGKGSRPRALPR